MIYVSWDNYEQISNYPNCRKIDEIEKVEESDFDYIKTYSSPLYYILLEIYKLAHENNLEEVYPVFLLDEDKNKKWLFGNIIDSFDDWKWDEINKC